MSIDYLCSTNPKDRVDLLAACGFERDAFGDWNFVRSHVNTQVL